MLIELDDVGLNFRVRRNVRISLKEYLLAGRFQKKKKLADSAPALEHINLRVDRGERLGVIGHNGAGKSTLLKLLAGIYPPSYGRRVVEGRICSLFDISLGFEQDATGWENIRYRSYLQGETPKTLAGKMTEIADFSELGEALDKQVRYYSTGMLVRLAFSVATAIDPEVLLVDEVLAAGDLSFQVKARERIRNLISRAQAVIVVSHDLPSLKQLCNRVIWLDHGKIRMAGPAAEVIAAYFDSVADPARRQVA